MILLNCTIIEWNKVCNKDKNANLLTRKLTYNKALISIEIMAR
jgi:hypothetical protein